MTAALAAFDVAAEGCGAAALDGRHHLQLRRGLHGQHARHARQRRDDGKMSATSSGVAPPAQPFGLLAFHQQPELLERACHRPDRLRRNAGIERCGVQLGMPEQHLDHADVDVLLEEMGGKAVPQRVGDTRFLMPAASAASWTARWS